jgi:Ca2+-binding RTX toxin-like protein
MPVFNGDSGNDRFKATFQTDQFNGGEGTDEVSYGDTAETVVVFLNGVGALGAAQGDTYTSIENLIGSQVNDILVGNDEDNRIVGGGGSFDELNGGIGNDTLDGFGNLIGGADNDVLRGGGNMYGGAGDDDLRGGAFVDRMDGGAGLDTVLYEGSDTGVVLSLVNGGTGGDAAGDTYTGIEEVIGSTHGDTINGDELANRFLGRDGDDLLKGFGGADNLLGGFGRDTLIGGEGDDKLDGGVDADILNGGGGSDTVDYRQAFAAVTIDLAQGKGFGDDAQGDVYASIENVQGSDFGDRLTGDGFANQLLGEFGNDTLTGGDGDDVLVGSNGNDQMFGGNGNDTYVVSDVGDTINELIAFGTDTVVSGINFSLSDSTAVKGSIENLTLSGTLDTQATGNALNNLLIGNSGDNRLVGNAGADTMRGGAGDDRYIVENVGDIVDEAATGSGGIDEVFSNVSFSLSGANAKGNIENVDLTGNSNINAAGNALANTLEGNGFKNDLMGLGGNDVLTGGLGADNFVFSAALNGATNVDTITDFNVVDDTIRLENAFMAELATGQLSAGAFHIGFGAADASDRIIYSSTTGVLSYDRDGSGSAAAIKFAELDSGLALTAADFLIV